MFQTGIHIALQSLASDWLTWLMRQVTALGYHHVIIIIVIVIMFGVSLRQGFLLFQIIAWTAVLTEFAKNFFGLPRPFFADIRVTCLEPGWNAAGAFSALGGQDFFDLPSREVIDAFRLKGLSFGFPSGHTSSAIAVWGGLAVVFRKRALAWLAPFMVALIAFTRVYLGVHFLADILGGLLLGGGILFLAWWLIGSEGNRERFFAAARDRIAASLPGALYLFFLFAVPLFLVFFSLVSMTFAGFYVGMNAAFTLALRSGLPADSAPLRARLARVLLGGLLFWLLGLTLRQVLLLVPAVAGSPWGMFLTAGLGTFLTIWGGTKLLLRLGLYHRKESAANV
jgi:membrane-associated phospholipid phosphatase